MRGAVERSESRSRSRAGRLLVPAVVAGAAIVVLATALGGRAQLSPTLFGGAQQGGLLPSSGPSEAARPAPPPSAARDLALDATVQTILVVLVSAVALAVAALLIRLLVLAVRDRVRRARIRGLAAVDADGDQRTADAPAVLRGIAAALAEFDEDREPGDAVVRAWLGLQQAAEDGGFARSPAETPTEFTGRVLSRTGADRAALAALLRLYLRARFDDGAITPGDTDDARRALRAVEASWQRATAPSAG